MTDLLRVTLAVLTFRRNDELRALLPMLLAQLDDAASNDRTIDMLVVDNDPAGCAEPVLAAFDDPRIRCCVEPRAGIAAARNRALDECDDRDVLVFIDDDERPTPSWLRRLLSVHSDYAAAAVAGPVLSEFDGPVDPWVVAIGLFDRRHRVNISTGTRIAVAATNNLLLDLRAVRRLRLRFPEGLGMAAGEDNLFTRQLTGSGGVMVWCSDAFVTEMVPAQRATRRWVMLRYLSSGNALARALVVSRPDGSSALRVRISLLLGGLVRIVAGVARTFVGYVVGSITHRARGTRTAVRGVGIILGACGYTYQAYRRHGDRGAALVTARPI